MSERGTFEDLQPDDLPSELREAVQAARDAKWEFEQALEWERRMPFDPNISFVHRNRVDNRMREAVRLLCLYADRMDRLERKVG